MVAGQTARAGRLTHAADALHLVARDMPHCSKRASSEGDDLMSRRTWS